MRRFAGLLHGQDTRSTTSSGSVPYTVVVPTEYGQMILNRNDINQTNALFKTGRACHHEEIELLRDVLNILGKDLVVLDIGANFGTHTLGLVDWVGPGGKIHSFEAQRIIFNMLAGSVALNCLSNVYCHHLAMGDCEGEIEIPQFDYAMPLNFGSVEFGGQQREPLDQQPVRDPARVETVRMTTVDAFNPGRVHLIKIDVEGMESKVLNGARRTIESFRPVLYVEFLKGDKAQLGRMIADLGYVVHENSCNFLGIPLEMADKIAIRTVRSGLLSRQSRLTVIKEP